MSERRIRSLLPFVTKGDWAYFKTGNIAGVSGNRADIAHCLNEFDSARKPLENVYNAQYIAACNPGTIQELLDELDKLRKITSGETCYICGTTYQTVYKVPNDVWKQIAPDKETVQYFCGGGLLCVECASSEAAKLGINLFFSASINDWHGGELK